MHLGKKKLQELKEKKISIEDLNDRYFIDSQHFIEYENILKLLNENICSLEEIVDKCKSRQNPDDTPCLYILLWNTKMFFEELIQNNLLTIKDLKYLLNAIDKTDDESYLRGLCRNTPLIKHILNEFVLDKKTIAKFNRMIENAEWCKDRNIYTIFNYIEYFNKDNEEILKLNGLNEKVCLLNSFDLTKDQKLELIEVLKDNEIARNRLIQIVDHYLESNYDFDSLMSYLKKKEKKNLINI